MCGGNGSFLGAALGAALMYGTGGFGYAAQTLAGAAAGGAAGAVAGDTLVDKPQQRVQEGIDAQRTAAEQATRLSERQADLAYNNQQRGLGKAPDVGAMLSGNKQAAMGGGSSTMLTGPGGVDPTTLNLGRNTLLGG